MHYLHFLNIGNTFNFIPIFRSYDDGRDDEIIGNLVVPIYIPKARNIKEIIRNFISNKQFTFMLCHPYIVYSKYRFDKEIYRYLFTDTLIFSLLKFVKINDNDAISNISPPEKFSYSAFIIHES